MVFFSKNQPTHSPRSSRFNSSNEEIAPLSVKPRNLLKCLQRFSQAKVLVIGDLILDHYIWGTVDRISPEAPVPVVHVESESLRLGGAANVYHNIISLEGQADVCGVVGSDEGGHTLLKELGLRRRGRGGIIIDPDRPTTRKTRVLAHSQQIVRYDVERRQEVSTSTTQRILRYVQSRLSEISCLVVSDYAKGVVTEPLMRELSHMARTCNLPIVVDPKVDHFPYFAGVTVLTPNHMEAFQGANNPGAEQINVHEAGHVLREKLGCEAVLVTRGERGMTLCEAGGKSWHIPAVARQVYDVTGAGDTVVSTMALALSTGASIRDGAVLANHAAGLVVGMVGTASITQAHLKNVIQHIPV